MCNFLRDFSCWLKSAFTCSLRITLRFKLTHTHTCVAIRREIATRRNDPFYCKYCALTDGTWQEALCKSPRFTRDWAPRTFEHFLMSSRNQTNLPVFLLIRCLMRFLVWNFYAKKTHNTTMVKKHFLALLFEWKINIFQDFLRLRKRIALRTTQTSNFFISFLLEPLCCGKQKITWTVTKHELKV